MCCVNKGSAGLSTSPLEKSSKASLSEFLNTRWLPDPKQEEEHKNTILSTHNNSVLSAVCFHAYNLHGMLADPWWFRLKS